MTFTFPREPADEYLEGITLRLSHDVSEDQATALRDAISNEFAQQGYSSDRVFVNVTRSGSLFNGFRFDYDGWYRMFFSAYVWEVRRPFGYEGSGVPDAKDIMIFLGRRDNLVRDIALGLALQSWDEWRAETGQPSAQGEAIERVKAIFSPGYSPT
jgi:hypothetical protein